MAASVALVGVATLVIRFSAPARPTEIVLASSAKELKPMAVAFCAVAWLPTPNTLLRSAVALTPAPIATELTPVAAAVSVSVKIVLIKLSSSLSYQPPTAIDPFLSAIVFTPKALLTIPDAVFSKPTALLFTPDASLPKPTALLFTPDASLL